MLITVALQKPSKNSKPKQEIQYLDKRLQWWKKGKLDEIMKECTAIQKELMKSVRKRTKEHSLKVFTRLELRGKMSAAMKWITGDGQRGIAATEANVIRRLSELHPEGQQADQSLLTTGTPPSIPAVIFDNIDADAIYKAALKTRGSNGPSGIDADNMRKMLCGKRFKQTAVNLCEARRHEWHEDSAQSISTPRLLNPTYHAEKLP